MNCNLQWIRNIDRPRSLFHSVRSGKIKLFDVKSSDFIGISCTNEIIIESAYENMYECPMVDHYVDFDGNFLVKGGDSGKITFRLLPAKRKHLFYSYGYPDRKPSFRDPLFHLYSKTSRSNNAFQMPFKWSLIKTWIRFLTRFTRLTCIFITICTMGFIVFKFWFHSSHSKMKKGKMLYCLHMRR